MERPPAPVTVSEAITQDVPVYLDQIGKVTAREVVAIQPQVSGQITKIHFTDGADVKKGALLFTIDPRPYESALKQAESNLARNFASKKQAESNLARDLAQAKYGDTQAARYSSLSKQGVLSKEQADQSQTNSDALRATVEADKAAIRNAEEAVKSDQAAIENAKLQLNYCYIKSPIDGRAGQRLVDIGNIVTPGATAPMLVIQRLDPIYADFTISQKDLSSVRDFMAKKKLTVEVRIPDEGANGAQTLPIVGDLTFLDNAVQSSTGTINMRATLSNKERRLWPGRFVNVRLVLDTVKSAVLVPATAPQMSQTGQFVYVVKKDNTAEMRPVTLGQRQNGSVVVESGVQAGDKVIVAGQMAVQPGGKVRPDTPKPETKAELKGEGK